MDIDLTETETPESFKKVLAKTFAQSVVGTAGSLMGLVVAGTIIGAVQRRRESKETKTTEPTES